MKTDHAFVAERPVAAHCAELLAGQRPAPDRAAQLAEQGARLCAPLARAFGRLGGFKAGDATAAASRLAAMGEIAPANTGLRGCFALRIGPATADPLLVLVDGAAVLRLLDKAFGGTGEAPDPLPDAFTLAAELFLARIEAVLVEAIALAFETGDVQPVAHGAVAGRVAPFRDDEQLHALDFEIPVGEGEPLALTLACTPDTIALIAERDDAPAGNSEATQGEQPGTAPACMDIPLTLAATLIDMRVGLSRLSALKPGDVVPVSLARQIPLRIGGRIVAHGTVGEVDERVALQITQAF